MSSADSNDSAAPRHEKCVSKRILFVCTGNTCRSPMAEAVAIAKVAEMGSSQVEVRSAGVAARSGAPASLGALKAVADVGLDLSHHSATLLDRELAMWADLILVMSDSHLERVRQLGASKRALLISDLGRGPAMEAGAVAGVPDPFGGSDQTYARTLNLLRPLVHSAVEGIVRASAQR